MDLIKARKVVEDFFKKCNFAHQIEVKQNHIHAKASNITLKGIDDDIAVTIGVFENGSMFIEFIFDKIKKLEKAADAINNLNQSFPFTKAYVTESGYFTVCYSVLNVETTEAVNKTIYDIFNIVGDDVFINALQKVTKLTK